ncbi:hypothetical protein N9940_00685 [bacterium]|nr:hypothetical protein [bacterium]
MADDISIGIKVTGGDDIVKVAKATVQLDSNVKLLSKTYDSGKLSIGAYYTGIQSQVKALVKMGVDTQKAKKYVSDLAKATIDASNASKSSAAATKAEATAVKAYAQARREATEANARHNAKAKEAASVAKVNALEEERLKNKFVEGYTAMNIYTKELNDLAVARKRGIIGANEQTAAVARLNTQMKAGTGVFANSAAGMQVVGKRANRAGVLAQQAGYQFGDFAVQVQSGTNIMVAAGQQATQLVGTFSMLAKTTKGIMAFSALGVIIPVITGIAAAFMRTKEAADDSSLAVKAFEERLKTAKEETVEMAEKLRFLQSGFGTESEFALHEDFAAATAELERLESALANANGPNNYFESEANRLSYISMIEDGIVLAGQEKDLAEAALQTYLETLAALELEEFQRQENLRLQEEAEAAAERYQALVERNNASYEDQLALALKINALGEDHADVARLRFEQEGKRIGLLGTELALHVSQQMILRGIVEATEGVVDAAGGIGPALQSAIDQANTFASAMSRAANAAAGINISTAGINAEIAALEGGASRPEARATAAAVSERERLTSALPSFEAGPRSSARIEGLVQERYDAELANQQALARRAELTGTPSTGGGGGGSDPSDQNDYLKSLQEEANFKRSLVGLGEAEITELERRREIVEKMTADGQTLNATDELRIKKILETEAATRRAIAAEEQRQATFDMVSGHIETAFMSMVDGSKSVEDAFKGMLRNILIEIYKQAIAKPIVGGIMSFLGFKDGGAFSGGNVIPFANGGVVSSATMFPMAGKQTGVMGEAGPEAIMPLKRGANGKLGVQVQGGGGENVVIHQNFNFQANGDDSVKRIIAQAAPQIANMTKKSMMDDRRRGGQMKTTFG